jgi:hypothetical protein
VAVISVIARNSFVYLFDQHGAVIAKVSRGLDAVAGAALTCIALFELMR